jgi:hypothetical protein
MFSRALSLRVPPAPLQESDSDWEDEDPEADWNIDFEIMNDEAAVYGHRASMQPALAKASSPLPEQVESPTEPMDLAELDDLFNNTDEDEQAVTATDAVKISSPAQQTEEIIDEELRDLSDLDDFFKDPSSDEQTIPTADAANLSCPPQPTEEIVDTELMDIQDLMNGSEEAV